MVTNTITKTDLKGIFRFLIVQKYVYQQVLVQNGADPFRFKLIDWVLIKIQINKLFLDPAVVQCTCSIVQIIVINEVKKDINIGVYFLLKVLKSFVSLKVNLRFQRNN